MRVVNPVTGDAGTSVHFGEFDAPFFKVVIPETKLGNAHDSVKNHHVVVIKGETPNFLSVLVDECFSTAWIAQIDCIQSNEIVESRQLKYHVNPSPDCWLMDCQHPLPTV
jgi:hypothetical protein